MAGVFGRSKDGDGVGGLGLVVAGDGVDLLVEPDEPASNNDEREGEQLTEEDAPGGAAAEIGGRSDHGCKNVVGRAVQPAWRSVEPESGLDLVFGAWFARVYEPRERLGIELVYRGAGQELQAFSWRLVLEGEGDLVGGNGALAEDHPGVAAAGEIDNGGGGGAGGGTAVDDEGDLVAELLADAAGVGALGVS